ncbi:hypothetical protein HYV81_02575 [Candidatus Woesearchaeota archaeon]|nr:hypothetical protein [Candidatus Woesearchaeota archaeon]
MKFIVQKEVFDRVPGLVIGVVAVKGCNNHGKVLEIMDLLGEVEMFISSNFTKDTVSQHQHIESWRKAFAAFRKEAHTYHTPVERLIRTILEKGSVEQQNKLVDIAAYISLKYIIPIACYDLDTIFGDIELGLASGTEKFIGAEPGPAVKVAKQEIIYKDAVQVLSRAWNWKQNYTSMISKDTKNALLVIEGLPPVQQDEVESIIKELIELIDMHCQGDIGYQLLNGELRQLDIGELEPAIKLRY